MDEEERRELREILWPWAAKVRLGLADEACTRQVAEELCEVLGETRPETKKRIYEELLESQEAARRRLHN